MTPILTAEQRAAYKTRVQDCRAKADRLQRALGDVETLEKAREHNLESFAEDARRRCVMSCGMEADLLGRVLRIGIDTLIAQLEQELADIDRPDQYAKYPARATPDYSQSQHVKYPIPVESCTDAIPATLTESHSE